MALYVVGGGISPFIRPERKGETEEQRQQHSYVLSGGRAVKEALGDSCVSYEDVDACVCSYCYCGPTSGQAVLYHVGLTGIPIYNTNNNCSSGSTALSLAANLLKTGEKDVVLVLGFEQMERGLSEPFPSKPSPTQVQTDGMRGIGLDPTPLPGTNQFTSDVIKVFAEAANEYSNKYPLPGNIFAEIAHKNRTHGEKNEKALFYNKKVPTPDECMKRMLVPPISSYMSAPTSDGAACVVVVSERFIQRKLLSSSPLPSFLSVDTPLVELLGISVATDKPETIKSAKGMCGLPLATAAANQAFQDAEKQSCGLVSSIQDIDFVELHDCFAPAELLLYEALGMCGEGEAGQLWAGREEVFEPHGGKHTVLKGNMGGRWVVNPSGGLESKGHPIGATGVAQAVEENLASDKSTLPRAALQHNFGFNGGAVVSVYRSVSVSSILNKRRGLETTNALVTPLPLSLSSPPSPFRALTEEERKKLSLLASFGWATLSSDLHLSNLTIRGSLPDDLVGTFVRNGPGVMNVFGSPLTHPIDGDGVVVCISFEGRKKAVEIHSAFVETKTRKKEQEAGKMLFRGQMGSRTPDNRADAPWRDPAHTNVIHIGNKLLALHEYALPHILSPRNLKTLGREDFGGRLKRKKGKNGDISGGSLCAHFRYDPIRNLSVFVSFTPARPKIGEESTDGEIPMHPPSVTFFEVNSDLEVVHETRALVPGLNYVHDLCVTPSFYIVQMTPFVEISPEAVFSILAGEESPGEQMRYFPGLPCRLVFVRRPLSGKTKEFEGLEAYPPVIQFDLPEPVHIYHFSRAVEMVVEEEERGKKHNESWEKKRKQEDPNNSPFLIPPCRLHAINKPYQTSYSTSSSSSPPPPPSPTFSTSSPCPSLTAGQFRTVAVEVEACVLQRGFNMEFQDSLFLSNSSEAPGRMAKIVCRFSSSAATMSVIDPASCEFPIINPARHISLSVLSPSTSAPSVLYDNPASSPGIPCSLQTIPLSLPPPPRFTFLMANSHGVGQPFCCIVRVDAFDPSPCARQVWCAGKMATVGEPCYFPKEGKEVKGEVEGYVVVQVQRLDSKKTEFYVLDANNLPGGPIAVIETGVLIPNGFHGTFSPEIIGRESSQKAKL